MNSVVWFAVLLCLFGAAIAGNVRIIEGIDKKSDKDDSKMDYVEPDKISGPPALYFMQGSCFAASFDRYEYSICPFQNITQRRTTALKPQLIGLWGDWKTTDGPTHREKMIKGEHKAVGNTENQESISSVATPATSAAESDVSVKYYTTMVYPKGKNCGVEGESIAYVYLQCEHTDFEVISVDSESSCKYSLTLGLPIPCDLLRGKM